MADSLRTQPLWLRWEGNESANLARGELFAGIADRDLDHGDVLAEVEADVSHHGRKDRVMARGEPGHGDGLALEVADRVDPAAAEQFVAADMYPGKDDDRIAGIEPADDLPSCEPRVEVDLPSG